MDLTSLARQAGKDGLRWGEWSSSDQVQDLINASDDYNSDAIEAAYCEGRREHRAATWRVVWTTAPVDYDTGDTESLEECGDWHSKKLRRVAIEPGHYVYQTSQARNPKEGENPMLYHHDSKDYPVAASEAAKRYRDRMNEKIEAGRASAVRLLEHVNTAMPADYVAKGKAMNFFVEQNKLMLALDNVDAFGIHSHALQQTADKAGIPGAYLTKLVSADEQEPWKPALAAHVLNAHYHGQAKEKADALVSSRNLIRVVNGEVRANLSDRYRRLDSRPLVDAFAAECDKVGAVPIEGVVTDLKVALKAFLPMVFEPVAHEVMCIGVEWSNSDFGSGKHSLRAFIHRLWCTNDAVLEDVLSQVHIGQRLSEDIEFSDKTFRLDTRAQVSALQDLVGNALAPKNVNALLEGVRSAHENKVDWKAFSTKLGKRLLKDELKAARDAFESDDVINLPAEKSVWRVSNAISWIAGKADPDRRMELQRLAGEVLRGKVAEAEAA